MIPWYKTTEKYGTYWKMNYGEYFYTVYFYEKEGDPTSCKDKFPIKKIDGSLFTKDDLCQMIQASMNVFNESDFGLKFIFKEHRTTSFDNLAFDMSDKISAIVIYWNAPDWSGLSAPFSQTQMGMKISVGENVADAGIDGIIKHEMEHVLGFNHKESLFTEYLDWRNADFVGKLEKPGGLSLDTLHGLDTVYNIYSDYTIRGRVRGFDKRKNAQAYLIDCDNWDSKKPLYQSPVDISGYYEFRLRHSLSRWKLLLLAYNDSRFYFNLPFGAREYEMKKGRQINLPIYELVDQCDSIKQLEKLTGINIKGL